MSWNLYPPDVAKKRWRDGVGMKWDLAKSFDGVGVPGRPMFDANDYYYLWEPDPPQVTSPDPIKKPNHYHIVVKGIEIDCWDVIKELGLWREYGIASAMKYLWRCLKKGNTLADLEKARAFLDEEIKLRKGQNV